MGKEKDVVYRKSDGKALPLKHEIPDDGNVEDSPDENSSGEPSDTQERIIPPSMRIRPINPTPIDVDRNLGINDDDDQLRNNPGRFPGVFHVPGSTGRSPVPLPRRPSALERDLPDIEQLPQAYPVTNFRPPIQDTPSTPASTTTQSINNNNHDGNETKPKSKKIFIMSILGLVSIAAAVAVAIFVTRNSDDTTSPSVVETSDDSINETTKLDIINLNTNTTKNNEASRTNETNQETSNMTNIITTTTSSYDNNDQHSNHSQTTIPCYTDPMIIHVIESDAYKNGDDPSIPRTYHFCPNSVMNVYGFDPIFNTFDQSDGVFPIILHRPNVNILCGFDGDYSNNCTFKGGFTQFVFNSRPRHLHYDVNTTAENITISGFRFTGATEGCTICNRNQITSLTIKNCRFDNNIGMFSSVYTAIPIAISSILHVHNTTFENNSYTTNPNLYSDNIAHGGSRVLNLNVGAITAFPNPASKAVVRVNVSDCVFQNNTFLTDSTSGETGAVINLLPPVSSVQITNSCFSGNVGYSSSLILLGRGREMISEDYNGNHFSSNEQDGIYEQSCIVNYQMLSFDAGRITGVIPQMGCGDYIDLSYNESESSGVCLI